jgi:TATA-binding protein-associated factor Taf7
LVDFPRKGRVQFDGWHFTSRLVDLPTIIESQKSIDNKTFYKTADICQLLICKEGDEFENEEASPNKRKKDPHKATLYRLLNSFLLNFHA